MQRLYAPFVEGRGAAGLLLLRLVFGLALMFHGFPKIQHATSWMGPGAPVPGFFQFLAAFSEFFGGLAMITGLLTPIAALGIAITMLTALITVHFKHGDPFVTMHGESFESPLGYFAFALLMILTGPGRLSFDAFLFGRRTSAAAVSSAVRAS